MKIIGFLLMLFGLFGMLNLFYPINIFPNSNDYVDLIFFVSIGLGIHFFSENKIHE